MTADRVFIEDLRIQTVIGIFDWEREITQTVSLARLYGNSAPQAINEFIDQFPIKPSQPASCIQQFVRT